MKKFCVYALRKKTNGEIFYIGKGLKKRAYEKRNRNIRCTRTMNKYGHIVDILKWFQVEKDAFDFEIKMIKEIGLKNLTNITLGGEGASGRIPSVESRIKCSLSNKGNIPSPHTVEAAKMKNRKKVGTKCGLVFESCTEAAEYIRENTEYIKASKSSISACCNGYKVQTAYGMEWFFIVNGESVPTGFVPKNISTRKVKTKCGKNFNSIVEAVDFLKTIGFEKAQSINIIQSCKKETRKAYGFKWAYADV